MFFSRHFSASLILLVISFFALFVVNKLLKKLVASVFLTYSPPTTDLFIEEIIDDDPPLVD
jgi:hypothetical protein